MELDSGKGSGGRRSSRGRGEAGRGWGVETDGKGVRLRIRGPGSRQEADEAGCERAVPNSPSPVYFVRMTWHVSPLQRMWRLPSARGSPGALAGNSAGGGPLSWLSPSSARSARLRGPGEAGAFEPTEHQRSSAEARHALGVSFHFCGLRGGFVVRPLPQGVLSRTHTTLEDEGGK